MTRPRDISFDGQTAIVTGAGNGLGRSHARRLDVSRSIAERLPTLD